MPTGLAAVRRFEIRVSLSFHTFLPILTDRARWLATNHVTARFDTFLAFHIEGALPRCRLWYLEASLPLKYMLYVLCRFMLAAQLCLLLLVSMCLVVNVQRWSMFNRVAGEISVRPAPVLICLLALTSCRSAHDAAEANSGTKPSFAHLACYLAGLTWLALTLPSVSILATPSPLSFVEDGQPRADHLPPHVRRNRSSGGCCPQASAGAALVQVSERSGAETGRQAGAGRGPRGAPERGEAGA